MHIPAISSHIENLTVLGDVRRRSVSEDVNAPGTILTMMITLINYIANDSNNINNDNDNDG